MSQSLIPPDAVQKILNDSTVYAAEWIRVFFIALWKAMSPYWPYVLGVFFIALITATVKLLRGQWGMIGSLIYHLVYFGILALIIAIRGFEVLFSTYFDLIYALLYPISYYLTGLILQRIRV